MTTKLHDRPAGMADLPVAATQEIGGALHMLLADVFVVYLKTKNFHWHMAGAHFRDYHLLLDELAAQIFAMTDPIAERARKIGARTITSIADIARLQRISNNDAPYVAPQDMLAELRDNNVQLLTAMRQVHVLCGEYGDVGTTTLLEVWIDETERRSWFLHQCCHRPPSSNL